MNSRWGRRQRRRRLWRGIVAKPWSLTLTGLGVAAGLYHGIAAFNGSAIGSTDCNIKGNISISGERIYHVPGQEYYDRTVIDPSKGERWFCSEWEARWAGWRKSKR